MNKMPFRVPDFIKEAQESFEFDDRKHLQLEKPEKIWSLEEFGYKKEVCDNAHFPIAMTSPFRLLSDEGIKRLNESIYNLKDQMRHSDRIANFVRGAVFYSPFLRELCFNQKINNFISEIAGKPILPHPMALYQGHLNFKPDQPEDVNKDVDKWHTDTVALDYVLLATDPATFEGGYFEYFQCTKGQAIRALIRDEGDPHIIKVEFPGAGYGVLQQGNLVVHRASSVTKGDERTTMVQSFIPDGTNYNEVSKLSDCKPVDPHEILFTEWARYKAFLSQKRLEGLIKDLPYTDDKNQICMELRRAIRDVEEAILEISDPSDGRLIHFGKDALTDPTF